MKLSAALSAPARVPSFGTSGIRATVAELTDLTVYCIAAGLIAYLRRTGRLTAPRRAAPIVIGGDLRPSSTRMLRAVARAIVDAGLDFEYAGRLPTPALALRALEVGVGCIVVTGSHIPADRNGLKAYGSDGELLKDDELPVAQAIGSAMEACLQVPASASPFGADAMLRDGQSPSLPEPDGRAARGYLDRYARAFPEHALAGLRVLVFEHSAVGRDIVCEALGAAGATVFRAGRSDAFVPIDTEAFTGTQLDELAKMATRFEGIDALVSTDGDGDRPLVLGVDANGGVRFVRGDALGVLVAGYLGADRIAVPVTSSPSVLEWAEAAGVECELTRVGSPYVIAAMRRRGDDRAKRVAGWEANGGFLLGSAASTEFGELSALPTRDALLPILAALRLGVRENKRVDEIAAQLPGWYAASGLLDGVETSVGKAISALLGAAPGRRPVDDARRLASWTALEDTLTQTCGNVEIRAASILDGLRLELSNDEVVHIRPSGNAPQLRVYVFARDPERAERLVDEAIREPDGLLRRLETLATGRARH